MRIELSCIKRPDDVEAKTESIIINTAIEGF